MPQQPKELKVPGVGNDPPPVYTVASLYPTVPAPATGGVNVGLLPPTGNPSAPARPQPPVVVISAQRQTIIGGHLPVEVDCDKCHAHVVTETQRVREDSGNCCLGTFIPAVACVALIPLIYLLVAWSNLNSREKTENPNAGGILTIMVLICFVLCCGLPCCFRARRDWRMYHYCPNCRATLANVPADAPTGLGQFYAVRNV